LVIRKSWEPEQGIAGSCRFAESPAPRAAFRAFAGGDSLAACRAAPVRDFVCALERAAAKAGLLSISGAFARAGRTGGVSRGCGACDQSWMKGVVAVAGCMGGWFFVPLLSPAGLGK